MARRRRPVPRRRGFQLMFAVITVALITGAVADRVKFSAWLVFIAIWVTVVYFPIAHWVWSAAANLAATGITKSSRRRSTSPAAPSCTSTPDRGPRARPGPRHAQGFGRASPCGRTTCRSSCSAPASCGSAGSASTPARRSPPTARRPRVVNTDVATCAAMLGWLVVEQLRDGKATTLGAASGAVAGLVGDHARPAAVVDRSAPSPSVLIAGVAVRLRRRPQVQVRLRRLARRRRRPPGRRSRGHPAHRLLRHDRQRLAGGAKHAVSSTAAAGRMLGDAGHRRRVAVRVLASSSPSIIGYGAEETIGIPGLRGGRGRRHRPGGARRDATTMTVTEASLAGRLAIVRRIDDGR